MNIILIGYRGTGKTAVSEILSKRLDMQCIGMDNRIVEIAGMSIPEIVQKYGWDKFRQIESDLAVELSKLDNIIIDAGGGIIEKNENINSLKNNAIIIWLKASVDIIASRIHDDNQRPALTNGKTFIDEISEVYERRKPKYKSASNYEIETDNLSPDRIADIIIEFVSKQK